MRRRAAMALLLTLFACVSLPPETTPTPEAPLDPVLLVGLGAERPQVRIGGTGPMRLVDPAEGILTALPAGSAVEGSVENGTLVLREARLPDLRRAVVRFEPGDTLGVITVDGRGYRGSIELRVGAGGVQVVNRVPLEQYLVGVVSAEMGPRDTTAFEALRAQAVAARTYAMRNRGRWARQGFDLVADVNDQVYAGIGAENALAGKAVAATRGEVVTFEGAMADVFYFSTCSGETEAGHEAFGGTPRPYLRSIRDVDSAGVPWCAISPRYTWEERWSAAELAAIMRRTLPAENLPGARAGDLTDLQIVDWTATRRAAALELRGQGGRTVVRGQAIRRVLGPTGGGILRSNDFTIRLTRSGGRITRVDISGRGNGHGVGMCQWGAIGRARAGQDYRTILTSYFPGTELTRMYP